MKRQHVKGASLDDWRGDVWQLGSGDDGARLDAGPKDVFIFELEERASTGFRWEAREAVDLGFGLIDDTSTFDDAVVGGTGRRRLVFTAPPPGAYDLRLPLRLQRRLVFGPGGVPLRRPHRAMYGVQQVLEMKAKMAGWSGVACIVPGKLLPPLRRRHRLID